MIKLLSEIVQKILNEQKVSVDDVDDAIDNHKRVIIDYQSKGDPSNSGARVIEVYAYGLTKAGNPVIRAFQPYGQTTTRVPSWKFFRLDRISEWKPTEQTFDRPADFYYKGLGDFNPNGDETMSVVYKIAKFGEENNTSTINSQPKTKEDVYKTDTELGMERLRQQLNNPRKIDLSQFDRKPRQKTPEEQKQELEKLRQTLKDNENMTLSDLNKKMNEPEKVETTTEQPELFKTDTERNMERLRQQLQNPQKIDLSRIPKK